MLKKKIERAGLNEDEVEEIREAFNLFDTENTGKIDPKVFIHHNHILILLKFIMNKNI
jgi:Ca2+-binding EF-hand superfamily protein